MAADETLTAPAVTAYGSWPQYVFTLEFTPRPYSVLKDEAINVIPDGSWTDEAGVAQVLTYADEWLRYVERIDEPISEVLTGQQGVGYKFVTASTSAPHGTAIPGGPQLRIARRKITLRWHDVPYRFMTSANSNLARYAGRINQATFLTFAAGSLLFEGARLVSRNPPPFPETEKLPGWDSTYYGYEQVATVDLLFEHVDRVATDAPTPSNTNFIAAGHNLFPRFTDNKFYYMESTSGRPAFLSAPFELLFTDPDRS